MSLVPVRESSPVVPKFEALVDQAIGLIAPSSLGATPPYSHMVEARSIVQDAINLLETSPVIPSTNNSNALAAAREGAQLLDGVLATPMSGGAAPMPRVRMPQFDRSSLDDAIERFEHAKSALNAHHL